MPDRDTTHRPDTDGARQGRISPRLTAILDARAQPDDGPYDPAALTHGQMSVLRAVVALVVPHAIAGLDIARRIDGNLALGAGDGWRPETLPRDREAYVAGLDALDAAALAEGVSFANLPDASRHALLASIADGTFAAPAGSGFDASRMGDWFDDLRSDAVRLYVAHPATMAGIGYEGHANGARSGAAFEGWSDRMIEDVR